MEKISVYCPKQKTIFRTRWKEIQCYRASDVDALLADVRRLMETGKTARTFLRQFGNHKLADRVDMQIAAVERHL